MKSLQTLGKLGRVHEAFDDVKRFHLGGEHVDKRSEQRRSTKSPGWSQ
jgi:hypothetical protein